MTRYCVHLLHVEVYYNHTVASKSKIKSLIPAHVTGTMGEELMLFTRQQRTKLKFTGGGYMVVGFEVFRILRKHRSPKDACTVLFWLYEHLHLQNIVFDFTQQQIAEDCGFDRTRVSRAIRHLELVECLQRLGSRRAIRLNPGHCFRGTG